MTAPDHETYSNNGAKCPHCGHLNDPSDDNYDLYSEDTCEWECGSCSTSFSVSVYLSYSWTCKPMEATDDRA